MLTAKVIGNVVATKKDRSLTGVKLLVIQPVNSKYEEIGKPLVAVDTYGAGPGEIVFFAKSKEGAQGLPHSLTPADAGVAGIIDTIYRIEE